MSSTGYALQKAIYDCLTADTALAGRLAGKGIYDVPPPSARFPYLTFGRTTGFDWSTSSERGDEILLSIHVWSNMRSRSEAADISGDVRRVLETSEPQMDGFDLVQLRLDFSEVRYDEEAELFHGLLRYHALIEVPA